MLAPPRICFRNPECVEARLLAGLGHGDGFVHGLHAQLQDTDIEWNAHEDSFLCQLGSFHECSRPLISSHIDLFKGVGTPIFCPHFTMAPFIKSTSVCRLARTSCSMLARCLPGAL